MKKIQSLLSICRHPHLLSNQPTTRTIISSSLGLFHALRENNPGESDRHTELYDIYLTTCTVVTIACVTTIKMLLLLYRKMRYNKCDGVWYDSVHHNIVLLIVLLLLLVDVIKLIRMIAVKLVAVAEEVR